MIWEKTEVEPTIVRALSEKYGIDTLLSSIFVRRGITAPNDIKFFLEKDTRFLHNPFLFKDMEDVIDRLHLAKEEGEKVLVFGDKDVDGVTSSVILYESLGILDLDLTITVPTGSDSYGLSVKVVDEAYNKDISLIITVDCGISAFDAINRAKELGISIIVIDHHNPRDGELPNADFIINPKVLGSGYPFSGLAACGVVSKVVWALCFSLIDSIYKSPICFLHGEDRNGDIEFSAVKLHNLVETNRLVSNDREELIDFLRGEQILVYGEKFQKSLFNKVFGTAVEIHVLDIEPEIHRVLRGIVGRSLQELTSLSKMRLYSDLEFRQIDLIISLFTTYIDRRYMDNFEPFIKTLDLVALGTVADLMPLKGENRILVNKGMDILSKTKREGLLAVMLKQGLLGRDLNSKDISWGLAPIINSAGRMKKADIAVEVLLNRDSNQKNRLALELLALNKERKSISDSIWSDVYGELHSVYEEFNNKLIVLYHKNMFKGVTGIIASRAQSIFNVPSIILAKEDDELTGSIRSPGNLDINQFFQGLEDILLEWGGHKCAAGFKLKYSDLSKFLSRVKKLLSSGKIITKLNLKSDKLKIDAFIPSDYLSPDIIKINDYFEPYGEANKPLVFGTKRVKIVDINFMGKMEKKHLKLLFEIGNYKWPGIFWNSAERVGVEFTKDDIVDIAYKVEKNFYGGNETLQLNIMDIIK